MTLERQKAEGARHKEGTAFRFFAPLRLCVFALILAAPAWAAEPDFAALCTDRAAVERVYYNHRTGTKPPFEETLPADALRRLAQADLTKEAALKKVYGVEVTAAMLNAEVQRINRTTRAPEILAELKAALGNDTHRFARTVARPIVVERLLRNRFENDDTLHAAQRREAERVREQLLKQKSEIRKGETGSVSNLVGMLKQAGVGQFTEVTWQLGARAPETNAPSADELEVKKRFGPDAQLLSLRAHGGDERKSYFDDLPGELQRVLRVQLRGAGDVSAVIETPAGFLLYVCKKKTTETLAVAMLTLPKRNYEGWLAEQPKGA
jgi:hypothetical protein